MHYLLKKNSIDTNLLRKISLVLHYDFFQHYIGLSPNGKTNDTLLTVSSNELKSKLLEVKKEINTLELHNSYLREIVNLISPDKNELMIKAKK